MSFHELNMHAKSRACNMILLYYYHGDVRCESVTELLWSECYQANYQKVNKVMKITQSLHKRIHIFQEKVYIIIYLCFFHFIVLL